MSTRYRNHEKEMRRQYEQRVSEVERSWFTQLVFSTTGEGGGGGRDRLRSPSTIG